MKYQRHPGNGQGRCGHCGRLFWCCFLYIVSEDLVFDNNRYYVSIRFSVGNKNYSYDELFLGPCLLKERNLLFNSYVNNMYRKIIKGYNKSIQFNSESFNELDLMINCLKKYI